MKGYLLIATITLLIVAGCSHRPIPLATSYPVTAQRKMQSAHHWDVLANDVAKRLHKTLDITFPNAVVKPSLFIKLTEKQEKMPFGKAFFTLLTTKLLQQGLVVMVSDSGYGDNLVVDYDMLVVHHKDRRLTYPPPGVYTALATGVWMATKAIDSWSYPVIASIPFGMAGDVNALASYYLPGETNTEVVLTTSVTMGQQYIFGDSRVYYINDGDFDHYDDDITKTYQVVNQW